MKKPKESEIKIEKTNKNLQNQIDEEFFKDDTTENIIKEDIIKTLTEDDLLDIIEGKKIAGIKITKEMRKNIKHGLKRGEGVEDIKKKYL